MSLSYKLHAIMYVSDYTFTYFCIGGSYKKQLTKNGEHVYTLGASDHIMDEVETMGRDFYEALALTHQDINEKEVKRIEETETENEL